MVAGPAAFCNTGIRRLAAAIALTAALPAAALSQDSQPDSIEVIERGTPRVDGWDVAELPFRIISIPLYLIALGAEWAADAAHQTRLPARIVFAAQRLNRLYLYPTASSPGAGAGLGGALLIGVPPKPGNLSLSVMAGGTVRGYWRLTAQAGYGPEPATSSRGGAFGAQISGTTETRTRDEFFGIGRASREAARSDYELERRSAGASLTYTPVSNATLRLAIDWSRVETRAGQNDVLPDIDSVFPSDSVPRFGSIDRFRSIGAAVEFRTGRRGPLRAQRWLSVEARWNESFSDGAADFAELDAIAGVVLPFDHQIRSLSLAVRYATVRRNGDGSIPFYRLPDLGGTSSLSAYRTGRFRGSDLVLGQAEYSYRVWKHPVSASAVVAALFLDAGLVADDISDELTLGRLWPSYGTALSLVTGGGAGGRLELARGDEGIRVNLRFQVGD